MGTQISPMLAVSDGNAAIEFYQAAFGATLLWHLDAGGHVVAGLSIHVLPRSRVASSWRARPSLRKFHDGEG